MTPLQQQYSQQQYPQQRYQSGFTLVELVVVIVVLAVLGVGVTQFIVNSSQGYVDTAMRERQGSAARAAIERISRELRNALPNSARTSADNQCLEYVPVLGASIYTQVPLLSASNAFMSIPFVSSASAPSIGRVAVYPIDTAEIYSPATTSAAASSISPQLSSDAADLVDTAAIRIELANEHRFLSDSPSRRWFMVDQPVSFCFSDGKLFRYSQYGFNATQALPGSGNLGTEAVPDRMLLAGGASGSFVVTPATLQRNALVQLNLELREQDEGVSISHEVQLRNVP